MIVNIPLKVANDFVALHHRHHGPVQGHKFSIGYVRDGHLRGVAIVGRPVARNLTTVSLSKLREYAR